MTIGPPESNVPNQAADVNSFQKSGSSFYQMDFEHRSVNNVSKIGDSADSTLIRNSSAIFVDPTTTQWPVDVLDSSNYSQQDLAHPSPIINKNPSPIGTPIMANNNLQYSPSSRPNNSPSFQHSFYPQQHQFNNGISNQPNTTGQFQPRNNSPAYNNNPNLARPNGYYPERHMQPQQPQQYFYRPNGPVQMGAPPMGTSHMGAPPMGTSHMGAPPMGTSHMGVPPMGTPQMGAPPMGMNQMGMQPQYNPVHRPLPPNPNYYPVQPVRPPYNPSTQDGNHLPDSTPKKSNKTLPFTKENLEMLRHNAANSADPKASLELAKFLAESVNQIPHDEQDPKRAKRTREAMYAEAQKILKKLANHSGMGKQGYPEAQFYLANCYGTGSIGLPTDPEKAFTLYVQGSKQNHPGCSFRAAVCYEVGAGTKRDKNHAMQFYRKAANLGDNTAMYKLGMILLKGFLGQPVNAREGISWLKRAAQQADEDHPHALHELGLCFEKEGIPSVIPDLNYARELFTQAAQYGYAPSQFKLGLAYENGFLNCPVDPRRSIAWYSKAAEQGDVEAEFALSGWYLTGAEGVLPQSDKEAYLWARKAADRGSAKAEYAVGYYTETGTGVAQNLEEAKRWYMRAAAQNYRKAMQRLTELKYGGARPQQRRNHTRDGNNTSSNEKDSECNIM